MNEYFKGFEYEGEIFPFSSVIRASVIKAPLSPTVRVYFVNGSIDIIDQQESKEFIENYKEWIDNQR